MIKSNETTQSHTSLVADIFKQRGFQVDVYNFGVICISLKNREVQTYEVTQIIDSEELPIADEQVYSRLGYVYIKFDGYC